MSLAERCMGLPTGTRRVVALLVVPLSIALLAAASWLPIAYVRDSQTEWRNGAVRLLSFAKQAPIVQAALDQQLAATRSSAIWSKFYKSAGAASSTTALHADLRALLADAQASVQSLTPIPAQEQALFTRIGARFSVSIRLNQLQKLLTAMANHPRFLRTERLMVVAPQTQASDENPPLAVTMDVYGYELSDSAAARGEDVLSARVNGER